MTPLAAVVVLDVVCDTSEASGCIGPGLAGELVVGAGLTPLIVKVFEFPSAYLPFAAMCRRYLCATGASTRTVKLTFLVLPLVGRGLLADVTHFLPTRRCSTTFCFVAEDAFVTTAVTVVVFPTMTVEEATFATTVGCGLVGFFVAA
jgi:hypothetical protein